MLNLEHIWLYDFAWYLADFFRKSNKKCQRRILKKDFKTLTEHDYDDIKSDWLLAFRDFFKALCEVTWDKLH